MGGKKVGGRRRNLAAGRGMGFESLEDRRLLAVAYADGELLVEYATSASEAARDQLRSLVRGRAEEVIETRAMRNAGFGLVERVKLGTGVDIATAIAALRNRPGVVSAEPNWLVTTAAVSNDPQYTSGSLWGMNGADQPTAIGPVGTSNQFGSQAENAWDAGYTGSRSVVVGIVDEGIDISHPDLRDNIWVNPFETPGDNIDNDGNGYVDDINGWDFFNNNNTVYDTSVSGEDSHGTHVAGTIGGVGGNAIGVAGVSWNVTMISTKFLGPGGGSTANAIKALDYLTDLKSRHGINIVASNNSWGGGGSSSALQSAIIRAAKADILFVAAAGNSASNNDATASFPSNYSTLQGTSTTTAASYEGVIAVAALTSAGGLASYSNYGAKTVDIGAPGSNIVSTLPGGTYGSLSGTSMAAPHVTGLVALYAAAYPNASAAAIRTAILSTARPTASLANRTVTGGRLDVAAAVNAPPAVGISISGRSVAEGNSGTTPLTFTVSLSAAAAEIVTVNFATAGGTATAGSDFTARSGTLSFAPGEVSKTIVIDVIGDTAFEANEAFTVALSSPSANARVQTGTATGTITNDDQQVVPTLSIASVSASESVGVFVFTVTLSQAVSTSVSVRFGTSNGTATAGRNGDYTSTNGTLTFNPGQTTRTISVAVANDTAVEPNETFFVDLSRASGASIAVSRGTGTIVNDDGLTAAQWAAYAALAMPDDESPVGSRKK
jgi:subtilisin family serine protease